VHSPIPATTTSSGSVAAVAAAAADDDDDEVAGVVGTSLLPNLGALLMMILFRVKGVLLGVTPSSIFAKYPAYLT
jgi:hypothetical protein